jgi:gamma-glutamyltranspeptidase/glutathione hydrolase
VALAAALTGAALLAGPSPGTAQETRRPTATGAGGAVATADPLATEAAMGILRAGGNAFDAAVAGAAVLGVTEPYSCGIGGGGFLVGWLAAERRAVTIDHREVAPAAVTEDALVDPATGKPYPYEERVTSGLAVGVPGTVAGWAETLARHGTMGLARVLAPAAEAARTGFSVDQNLFDQTSENRDRFDDFTSTRALYLTPGGQPHPVGTVLRNPDLAAVLEAVGTAGPSAFYSGETAARLVETVQNPPLRPGTTRNARPGRMTLDDLANYRPLWRDPVRIHYRGYDVFGMGPPSSGGPGVAEALQILEGENLTGMDRTGALHRVIETSRLVFADRDAYIGDPAFTDVPLAGLISDGYAADRRSLIGPRAGSDPAAAGDPWPYEGRPRPGGETKPESVDESESTTHLTVADRWGNVAAYTFTLEEIGGNGMVVPGGGFLLNNQMADFEPVGPHPNTPAAGKRPRSAMSPTIVTAGGRPVLALGSPGGATIITTVIGLLVETLDFGRSLPEAIALPRASQRNTRLTSAEHAFAKGADGAGLHRLGHRFDVRADIGAATGLQWLRDGTVVAAAEPSRRGGGSAMTER